MNEVIKLLRKYAPDIPIIHQRAGQAVTFSINNSGQAVDDVLNRLIRGEFYTFQDFIAANKISIDNIGKKSVQQSHDNLSILCDSANMLDDTVNELFDIVTLNIPRLNNLHYNLFVTYLSMPTFCNEIIKSAKLLNKLSLIELEIGAFMMLVKLIDHTYFDDPWDELR